MNTTKVLSTREYINLCIQESQNTEYENKKQENKFLAEQFIIREANADLFEQRYGREKLINKFRNFSESVKSTLLAECMYKLYDSSLGIHFESTDNASIKRNFINRFIEENSGPTSILNSIRTKSFLLSEFNRLVIKYHKIITESVDKDDPTTFKIDATIKDNFFDELNEKDLGEVSAAIRIRVTDAMEEFIQANISDKIEIEQTLKDAQEKINASKIEEVRESYGILAKQKISKIRNSRRKNILSELVSSMSKSVLKNDYLKEEYMKDNKLNIDKIVERCELMYTFMEMLNTSKFIDINESYIKEVLESMKQ